MISHHRRSLLVFLAVFVAVFVALHPASGAAGACTGTPAPHAAKALGCASVDPPATGAAPVAAAFALGLSRRPTPGRLSDQTHPSPDPDPPRPSPSR